VDPRLAAIVDKLLAPQIENRYQTARQIADDLQAYLDGTTVIAHVEALRADQATVRIEPRGPIPRGDDLICPTEPLPSSVGPLVAGPSPEPAQPVAMTAALPGAQPAAVSAPVPSSPESVSWRHRPWLAALLSLLAPGFGQIYNREYVRALFWLIITPGFWIGSAGLFGWPFHIVAAYTAYRRAQLRCDFPGVTPMRLPRLPILNRRAAA
jgi:hypothetical protein